MVVLCAINSSYSHTNPAVRVFDKILKEKKIACTMLEFTVNEPYYDIISNIYQQKGEVVCFSCYLWNIEMILRLCTDYYQLSPTTKIILGGPEVSYESEDILRDHPNVIQVVRGEGEEVLPSLLSTVLKGENPPQSNETEIIADLNSLPFLYDDPNSYHNKILYYETSRGCPFRCCYCLSSLSTGVRFLEIERVKRELLFMKEKGAKIIKFLDRTFNCNSKRAKELFRFLSSLMGDGSYHFEICVDLLDDETMEILQTAPKGRFQFEIGIQSVNPKTLKAIERADTVALSLNKLEQLKQMGNIMLHVDLIAGLPYDTKESIYEAIDRLYFVSDELQLGFLKLLKGTSMRHTAEQMGYRYQKNPPYEVYSSPWITFDAMLELKQMECVITKYKNSRCFEESTIYLIEQAFVAPSAFLRLFCTYLAERHFFNQLRSRKSLYEPLYLFAQNHLKGEQLEQFAYLLEIEYIRAERSGRAPFLPEEKICLDRREIHKFLHNPNYLLQFLPLYNKKPATEILKNVEFHVFGRETKKILLFDFLYDKIQDVTDCF